MKSGVVRFFFRGYLRKIKEDLVARIFDTINTLLNSYISTRSKKP